MYTSKTGKKFGSSMVGKKYDEMHSEDGMHKLGEEHEAKETPELAGEQEGATEHKTENEGEEQHEGEQHPVVTEHGPAHKIIVHHDEASGRHTVTSHHKDGHMHTEMHEDVHKAHHAGKRLAGIHDASEEEKPAQHAASAAAEEDGFQMPGLE